MDSVTYYEKVFAREITLDSAECGTNPQYKTLTSWRLLVRESEEK